MFDNVYPRFSQKPIVPTKGAAYELDRCDLTLKDVVAILREGFDCSRSSRAFGKLERGIQRGKKLLKVVVVEKPDRWILIHAGRIGISRKTKGDDKNAGQ